jgi:hypothetical protein
MVPLLDEKAVKTVFANVEDLLLVNTVGLFFVPLKLRSF